MEAKANYTLVGLVVVILSAALLSVGLWLSVGFNQKSYSLYSVYLHEAASGLNQDAAVKYNGVQVGFVKEIKLTKNDPRQVQIILSIEDGTPITTSTFATLISQGITGVSYVGLSAGSADLTPLERMPGEPYPVIPAKPSLFYQLDAIIREASDNVTKVSKQIKHMFNKENAEYVRKTLENMDKITTVFAKNSNTMDNSLKSAEEFLENLAEVSKDFPVVVKRVNKLSLEMSNAGVNISKTMVSGRNAIDGVSPEAAELIRRLNTISANLEKVTNEMRQNPSVIIRGTTPPKPGPGE